MMDMTGTMGPSLAEIAWTMLSVQPNNHVSAMED